MSKHTTLLQDLRRRSKHFVVNTNSSCGVMWSVQSLIFADLSEDLGRAHWITPFVESKPGKDFGIKLQKLISQITANPKFQSYDGKVHV